MADLPIEEMNLSVRASNALMRANAKSFGRVMDILLIEDGLKKIRNLGVKRGNSSDAFRRRSSSTRNSGHKAKPGSGGGGKTAAFSASSGFNMPNMAGRMT